MTRAEFIAQTVVTIVVAIIARDPRLLDLDAVIADATDLADKLEAVGADPWTIERAKEGG